MPGSEQPATEQPATDEPVEYPGTPAGQGAPIATALVNVGDVGTGGEEEGEIVGPEWAAELKKPGGRHYLSKLSHSKAGKVDPVVNTVIVPAVEEKVKADMALIRARKVAAVERKDGRYVFTVEDRSYETKWNSPGKLFPLSGTGFYALNPQEYKALRIYREYDGDTEMARKVLGRIPLEARVKPLHIWEEA